MKWDLRSVLAAAGSASVLGALTVILGRFWTQSYYAVFGLPTTDLEFDVMDYAFRTKEILLMLFLAAFIGGALWLLEGARHVLWSSDPVGLPSKKDPQRLVSFRQHAAARVRELVRFVMRGPGWLPLFGGLNLLGRFILISAALGLGLLAALANFKPSFVDWVLVYSGVLGLWGGVSLGLAIGTLGVMVWQLWQQEEFLWCAPPAAAIVALVAIFIPWSTGELAEFRALRDLRTHSLPQAIIEFRDEAPAAIGRSDDPTRSALVHVLLATESRLSIAYPFGCKSVGEPESAPPVRERTEGTPRSEICDIFSFDREDVRAIRIFGKGTERPFNDDRGKPDIIELAAYEPTEYDELLDLTAARKDECGSEAVGDARGVWLRLDARQSGRLSFERRPEVYLSPADRPGVCVKLADGEGARLHDGDQLMVLAAAPQADRIVKPLKFTFFPLEFRTADRYVDRSEAESNTMSIPFRVHERATVAVILDVNDVQPFDGECGEEVDDTPEDGQPQSVRISAMIAPLDSDATVVLNATTDLQDGLGATGVTLAVDEPFDEGSWLLTLRWCSPGLNSFRIKLWPVSEEPPLEEQGDE